MSDQTDIFEVEKILKREFNSNGEVRLKLKYFFEDECVIFVLQIF